MDAEATNWTYYEGQRNPTGLLGYVKHIRPNIDPQKRRPRYHNEDPWCNRVMELLNAANIGLRVGIHPSYPKPSKEKGDLLMTFDSDERLFIEVKPAYKAWLGNALPTCNKNYRSFLLSPERNRAIADFHKLDGLDRTVAEYAGFLLVGFDIPGMHRHEILPEDISELLRRAGVSCPPWVETRDSWHDVHHTAYATQHGSSVACRVRCWLWWRKI